MRCNTEEVARELTAAHHGRNTLIADINDIAIWLSIEIPGFRRELRIDQYRHLRRTMTMSHVVVFFPALSARDYIRERAETSFKALGWAFDTNGFSEAEWFLADPIDDCSAHRQLVAFRRIQDAFQNFSPATDMNAGDGCAR